MATTYSNEYWIKLHNALAGARNSTYNTKALNSGTSTVQVFNNTVTRPATPASTSSSHVFYGASGAALNFAAATGGVARLGSPRTGSAGALGASGTASWARINLSQVGIIDVDVSLAGGGGGIILSSLDLSTVPTLDAMALFMPEELGTIKLNAQARNQLLDAFTTGSTQAGALGGAGSEDFFVYDGTPPSSIDDPATGTLLFTGNTDNFAKYIWDAVNTVSGVADLTVPKAMTGTLLAGTHTPTYWRQDGNNGAKIQGSMGTGSSNDIVISANSFQNNQVLDFISGSLTPHT